MFIVAITKPYYPEVHECETWDEAVAKRDEILAWNHSVDAGDGFTVFIADVRDVSQYLPEEE